MRDTKNGRARSWGREACERRDYRLSPRVWIMHCSHNAKIWLANNAGVLTTRCQRAVSNYDGWCFTGLLISISEIDSLKPDYRSFAIASRRRWCPRNSANSLQEEIDISSVLFGKVFLKPKCKNQVPWPDQPDDIFPLPLVWRSQINSPSKPCIYKRSKNRFTIVLLSVFLSQPFYRLRDRLRTASFTACFDFTRHRQATMKGRQDKEFYWIRLIRLEILHQKITRPWKGKLLGLGGSPSFRVLLAPGFHAAIFFAIFFRITHDGLSERGTTHSLNWVLGTRTLRIVSTRRLT